jgi:hypothetical protein
MEIRKKLKKEQNYINKKLQAYKKSKKETLIQSNL